jgi:hypothetical protein
MKVYITENIDKVIEGYVMIPIIYGKVDLGQIPNNAAQSILATDALDSIPVQFIDTFLEDIRSKMRFNSELVIGGTELSIVSRDILLGNLNTQKYNELIFSKRGIYNVSDIISLLQNKNLTINKSSIKGYNYEISVTRSQASN